MYTPSLTTLGLVAGASALVSAAGNTTYGFQNPTYTTSSNGTAECINGFVDLYAATSKNIHVNLAEPANQTVVTEFFVEMLQIGSTQAAQIDGADANISGTFEISIQLCYPRATGINASAVQFLTHGVGFDKSYWDVAPGYSYIDVAAANGYTTFSYDRLGVGLSAKPDGLQVVQSPLEVSIAHNLIQMLRGGSFSGTKFSKVIGVGHSFGSIITNAITVDYLADLDAAVLTGFSLSQTGVPTFYTSLDFTIANQLEPIRFSDLMSTTNPTQYNSYVVANNINGNQFAFFRAQGFPVSNLVIAEQTKQTATLGEFITLGDVTGMTNYTGPVIVVNGQNDWPFCQGNCSYPTDQAAAVKELYPMSKSFSSYLAPNCGHGINLHYAATPSYNTIMAFLAANKV